ncbi:MAG: cytidylate kinase-like family protein [candidate division Zixibacteria bacterium]|nr:cytidylate kinase-like family protein [candidate division Zixibacteria bacterium]
MSSVEAIIDRQVRRWELERKAQEEEKTEVAQRDLRPVITVSRQRGSRGSYIAERIAERFHYTLLHRDLIDYICKSSGYKRRIVASLDQQTRSQLESWFEGVFAGFYVDHSDYSRHLREVIYSISALGGVVVVGRGANLIVGMERGFHVRVVAPRKQRIRNLITYEKLSEAEAGREVEENDRERREFIRKQLGESIDDPLHYDLVINSEAITNETAINIIAIAAMEKFTKLRFARD